MLRVKRYLIRFITDNCIVNLIRYKHDTTTFHYTSALPICGVLRVLALTPLAYAGMNSRVVLHNHR